MSKLAQNQSLLKLFYGIIFSTLLLALLAIVFWQKYQTQTKSVPQIVSNTTVEVRAANEPIYPIPLQILLNPKKVELGEKLFQEPRLSYNNKVSCATCHNLATGGVDRLEHSMGINGVVANTNTSTVFNSGFNFKQEWNGQYETLEAQADGAITNSERMRSNWTEILGKLRQSSDYKKAFALLYDEGITKQTIEDAIATYERSLYTPNSRFDQYLRGNNQAITAQEKEGYRLFKTSGCISCHQGVNVGGNLFQKFGIIGDYFADRGNLTDADLGRFNVTKNQADLYVFKVPSLRNIVLTAPYFHDGSAKTLAEAVAVMAKYQLGRELSAKKIDLIVQFLRTLSGEYQGKPL
jgi:cytochrome c peroxidase